jgi:hypothetical protein
MSKIDPYKDAMEITKQAKKMFEDHSLAITGNKWVWEHVGDEIRTIWIITAVRSNAKPRR